MIYDAKNISKNNSKSPTRFQILHNSAKIISIFDPLKLS